MSAQSALESYYSKFQIRSVLAASARQVFGRPKGNQRTIPDTFESNTCPNKDYGSNTSMVPIYFSPKIPGAKIFAIEPEASASKAPKKAVFKDARWWVNLELLTERVMEPFERTQRGGS